MSRITRALLALALLALAAPASAAAAPQLVPVGSFDTPMHVAAPPGDPSRLFVAERGGAVRLLKRGSPTTTFLTITDVATDGERGLLSIAFPRDYATSGRFYVYMVADDPVGEIQVREYRRSTNPDVADPATRRIVFRATHDEDDNHNGGQLAFGPDDKLWFATGDGGGSNNQYGHARDLGSPLGKVLRIDPLPGNAGEYGVPADNPFGTAVWAYGLRNPFRFSFDRTAGDLWIGDVGQGSREEINWVLNAEGLGRGTDYEWDCREGSITRPGSSCTVGSPNTPPVFDYTQVSPRAVTGGVLVRDPGLPTLNGRYLWADYFPGDIHALTPARPRATDVDTGLGAPNLVAFGEDACGHVYVVSASGPVSRIQDGAVGPCVPIGGGGPVPAPPAAPGPPDRTSPRINVRVARKGRVGRRATPRILVTASENCRVTITARLAKTNLKRVRTPLRGGRRTVIRLRPKAGAIKKIRRALRRKKRVTMTVKVVAVDAAGNTGRVTKRLKVRRG